MDFSGIKLIIWDLDETLWKGTISEGNVEIDQSILSLLSDAIDSGVMMSICSKNDESQVVNKLKEHQILDLFVFKSINWSPKGGRVAQIISDMNLRPVNVLFIDDNPSNLAEVQHAVSGINVSDEHIVSELGRYYAGIPKKDLNRTRLQQYKVLEEKKRFKATIGDNVSFLVQSHIECRIKKDCANQIERIHELMTRTNQLNFTKNRLEISALSDLISDKTIETAYVEVSDRFGDYGIVGFFAITNKTLLHFFFSCRVMGMGIEQWVFRSLGEPSIRVIGEVASDLRNPLPFWINQSKEPEDVSGIAAVTSKVLLKGPCDLSSVSAYLKDRDGHIKSEFTYINEKGIAIESTNHSIHILESIEKPRNNPDFAGIYALPISDNSMFDTSIFDPKFKFVVLSVLQEAGMGVYKDRKTGKRFVFGSYAYDLTNESNWPHFVNKDEDYFVSFASLTMQDLRFIQKNFIFEGRLSPRQSFDNLKQIFSLLSRETHLVLLLGSETDFSGRQTKEWEGRAQYHKEINAYIRKWAREEERVQVIDVNKYIRGQESLNGCTNHYSREVYYSIAKEISTLTNSIKPISKVSYFFYILKTKIRKAAFNVYHHLNKCRARGKRRGPKS